MKSYSDLLTEIEIVKDQIELTESELEFWYGINQDGNGIPLGGKGSHKYGANTSVIQAKKKQKSLDKLNKRLKGLEYAKVRQDMLLEKFEGLEYKIAYLRIVENKSHKEIAVELNFTEQYIRRKWMESKSNIHATDTLENP